MKIEQILVSGFRGFRDRVEISFAPGFTVIDGRNGVGKSTIFDALEFALTGRLTKYGEMKASGESVDDYIWWKGQGPAPSERFVEVALSDGTETVRVRRTPLEKPDRDLLLRVEAGMVTPGMGPASPLLQLCAASIIRDESIAALSLDLSETQRYAKLRQAIGANDADQWAERGARLVAIAKRRSEAARSEVVAANLAIAEASRRVDDVRASLIPEAAIAEASASLAALLHYGQAAPDQLLSPAREFVASREKETDNLTAVLWSWEEYERDAAAVADSDAAIEFARAAEAQAHAERAALPVTIAEPLEGPTAELVARLHELRSLGASIGLVENGCPLCTSHHDETSFAAALVKAAEVIDRINRRASEIAEETSRRRSALTAAEQKVADTERALAALEDKTQKQRRALEARSLLLDGAGVGSDISRADLERLQNLRNAELEQARHALRVLSTISQNQQLEEALANLQDARARLAKAQDKAGRARQAEAVSSALHDAARRAGSETLDLRLERVLPLMAELYARLRPHPVWQDIEYSIRGDVRRFLSLQVGEGLNPQFLFSSGQRRATGLAFLMSINLSLAWSRWRSILLDDPVQHVDDFRAVNLAEVLAQLINAGRQVIIAVEDPALADLLARRMPTYRPGEASRLTLGLGTSGCSAIIDQRELMPTGARVLAA